MRLGDFETWGLEVGGRKAKGTNAGFTLFEVLLTILILLIAIVPMIDAFRPSLFATAGEEANVVFTNRARHTLNRAASLDFKTLASNLGTPSLDTLFGVGQEAVESFSLSGLSYIPSVSISDASGGIGGLLEIAVTINNQVTLKTLKADY